MTLSSQPATSLLDSIVQADSARVDASVTMLKKAQDLEKSQGAAMVKMLERAVSPEVGQNLDAYA